MNTKDPHAKLFSEGFNVEFAIGIFTSIFISAIGVASIIYS